MIGDFSIPKIPNEFVGKTIGQCGYTKSIPREWTNEEIEWVKNLHHQGYSNKDIAYSVGRTEIAIQIKLKRLGKSEKTYNKKHIQDKYETNLEFVNFIKPKTIIDAFSGEHSYYETLANVISNDKNTKFDTDYNLDALKFLCKMYCDGKKADIVDLDPFGSAYECFDLAIKMANKGLVITFGELGHKRFKRLDFVERYYGISSLEDFTLDNLIKEVQKIGLKNKKQLIVYAKREWQNIGRVWFVIKPLKITSQWESGDELIEYKQS